MLKIIVKKNHEEVSKIAKDIVIQTILKKPSASLMLPTGQTAKRMYFLLSKAYQNKEVDFSKASFFQLDDLIGVSKKNSYSNYLRKRFFNKVNFKEENVHLFDSNSKSPKKDCVIFEKKLRKKGVDLAILGLGKNGHIAFNEPGSKKNTKTRVSELSRQTKFVKKSNKKVFTIGISSILIAKKIFVIATGKEKSKAISQALNNINYIKCPVSILNKHKNSFLLVDKKAFGL